MESDIFLNSRKTMIIITTYINTKVKQNPLPFHHKFLLVVCTAFFASNAFFTSLFIQAMVFLGIMDDKGSFGFGSLSFCFKYFRKAIQC